MLDACMVIVYPERTLTTDDDEDDGGYNNNNDADTDYGDADCRWEFWSAAETSYVEHQENHT